MVLAIVSSAVPFSVNQLYILRSYPLKTVNSPERTATETVGGYDGSGSRVQSRGVQEFRISVIP